MRIMEITINFYYLAVVVFSLLNQFCLGSVLKNDIVDQVITLEQAPQLRQPQSSPTSEPSVDPVLVCVHGILTTPSKAINGTLRCKCQENWSGHKCNLPSHCISGDLNRVTKLCECFIDYFGDFCQFHCVKTSGNWLGTRCQCNKGFYGDDCARIQAQHPPASGNCDGYGNCGNDRSIASSQNRYRFALAAASLSFIAVVLLWMSTAARRRHQRLLATHLERLNDVGGTANPRSGTSRPRRNSNSQREQQMVVADHVARYYEAQMPRSFHLFYPYSVPSALMDNQSVNVMSPGAFEPPPSYDDVLRMGVPHGAANSNVLTVEVPPAYSDNASVSEQTPLQQNTAQGIITDSDLALGIAPVNASESPKLEDSDTNNTIT